MLRTIQYSITKAEAGKTVEQFLKSQGISQRVIIALKKLPDGMLLDGAHVRTIDPLTVGSILQINLPQPTKRIPLCDVPVPVLYEDEDILIYNKPPDMPCHQSGGHIFGTLDGVYAAHCVKVSGVPRPFRPINRLDKDTTGAVVAAQNQIAAGKLWKAVEKRYLAVVEGVPNPPAGVIDLPIEREMPMEIKRIVSPDGQEAVTRYRVLAQNNGRALVAFQLLTGRTHQIRVHMACRGWPLVGDPLYGMASEDIGRQALHCAWVSMPHPQSGTQISVAAPLPQDFSSLLTKYAISWNEPEWSSLFCNFE